MRLTGLRSCVGNLLNFDVCTLLWNFIIINSVHLISMLELTMGKLDLPALLATLKLRCPNGGVRKACCG